MCQFTTPGPFLDPPRYYVIIMLVEAFHFKIITLAKVDLKCCQIVWQVVITITTVDQIEQYSPLI